MPDTERMTLRRPNWPDIDDVVALSADGGAAGARGEAEPLTPARVLAVEMPRLMADVRRTDELGSWVARDRQTGGFLGWFTLAPVDDPPRAVRLGYRLPRRAEGRGYDTEAVLRLVEMARSAGVSAVLAVVSSADVAARRVLEAAGLRPVGTPVRPAAEPGPAHDQVDYQLDLDRHEDHQGAPG